MTIEEDFKKICDEHMSELDAADAEACAAIQRLEDLSEKYGIPYRANVSPLRQNYTPESYAAFQTAYAKEVEGLTDEDEGTYEDELSVQVLGTYPGEYEGWQHSAVCY